MVMTVEERKEKRKVWDANYRAKNKNVIKDYSSKYYLENKEKLPVRSKKNKAANKEKYDATRAAWTLKNKEDLKLKALKYYSENKSKIADARAMYVKNNKGKVNSWKANRRAKLFGSTVYMTKEDKAKIAELYTIAKDASKLFGYDWAVDHIVPLNKGGLHKLSNLQVVPATWNSAKRDRNCDTYWD